MAKIKFKYKKKHIVVDNFNDTSVLLYNATNVLGRDLVNGILSDEAEDIFLDLCAELECILCNHYAELYNLNADFLVVEFKKLSNKDIKEGIDIVADLKDL